MAADGDQDVCAVCLEGCQDLKFLPCHHSFCARCIQGVADRHRGTTFPCPSCRKHTSLPEGGVASLQSNFYIKRDKAQRTSSKDLCPIHADKKLEFYCVKCDQALCLNCKLTDHELHKTVDLHRAVDKKLKELSTAKDRLQCAVAEVIQHWEATREEQQAVRDKAAAVERNIRQRHATMVAAADKFRDEALESLQSVITDIDREIAEVLTRQEEDMNELITIQRQLEQAVSSKTGSDIITIARELKTGRGNEQEVSRVMSPEKSAICRPVLHFNVTTDVMVQKARDYLGTVSKMEIDFEESEVTVVERFKCGQESDIEVFSLCHVDKERPIVRVSYDWCGLNADAPSRQINENGRWFTVEGESGKISYRRYAEGKYKHVGQQASSVKTYSKSLTAGHFRLRNDLSGQASLIGITVISTDTLETKSRREFTISVGVHRAFDVDDSEQFFVVVEEAQLPDMWRKVRLYRRPERNAVSTYSPPTNSFQPSDVCFYKLNGQQVLLVTDELNDVIHVVHVQDVQMIFLRYLAPGCPLLIQPTAINVDIFNRLWLACRGGNIISMEPNA